MPVEQEAQEERHLLLTGEQNRLHERQVMVMVWIMANPHWGTLPDLLSMRWCDLLHNRGTLWTWGLAFQEEMYENSQRNQ